MTLLTEALILGLFAMSLDLMVGYTRLISFGHAAAYGFGAYACGWLLLHTSLPMLAAIPLAALLAGVLAIGIAWVCTQASGVSFSMLTLAFAQLLYAVAYKWTSVTGGSDGLAGIPRRVGFPGHNRRWLLNQIATDEPPRGPIQHQAWRYLRLVRELGGAPPPTEHP